MNLLYFLIPLGLLQAINAEDTPKEILLENICGAYTHRITKPMLGYFNETAQNIELKNEEIRQLKEKVIKLETESVSREDSIKQLTNQNQFLQQTIHKLTNQSLYNQQLKTQNEIMTLSIKVKECESHINSQNETINNNIKARDEMVDMVEKCTSKLSFNSSFEVLYDSEINGPGWIVIQQRINGDEDFRRDWATYREGFGKFNGDFFLGLEKIHLITNNQPHELFIYMKTNNSETLYKRYDDFAISREEDNYRLIKLGKPSGNATDSLDYHRNAPFSTKDRDNDSDNDGNCADFRQGPWWHKHCASCNLNGLFYTKNPYGIHGIKWGKLNHLKLVKMLIRPKLF